MLPLIAEGRETGKTDQEIYNELIQKYYDKKGVALLITGTATDANKEKYKALNNLLIGLLGSSIILKILSILAITVVAKEAWLLILVFLAPLFAGYFMYETARYNGPMYRICGWLTIAAFLQSIDYLKGPSDVIVNIFFAGAIAGLSFYLDSRLFPDYSPRNLVKDGGGEFVLSQHEEQKS